MRSRLLRRTADEEEAMKVKTIRQRRWLPILTLLLLVFLLGFAGAAAARYAMRDRQKEIVEAKNFYFESDFLKEKSEKTEYFIDPMETEFPIKLHNYADSQRVTQTDITYHVDITGGTVGGTAKGTLVGSGSQSTETISIVPLVASGAEERTVTVTATSDIPYTKVLTATFVLKEGNDYTVEDAEGNRAAVLTMTCADAEKEITITLPDGVIPDEANDRVTSSTNTSGENICTFHSPGYGVYSLVLLKTNKGLKLAGNGSFADTIKLQAGR